MPPCVRVFLILIAGWLPAGAEFVPPADGPVPFRRDRLPLDVDTMATLSRQVVRLAGGRATDEPGEQRAVAQMTALALALDPSNREARELMVRMRSRGTPELLEEPVLEQARRGAWRAMRWLESPDAGSDGQALAKCLGDVLALADPEESQAATLRMAGERGAWKDWVAEEAAFRPRVKEPEKVPEAMVETPEEKPEMLVMNELSAKMPLWYTDKLAAEPQLGWVEVNLRASIGEKKAGVFTIAGNLPGKTAQQVTRAVEAAMKQRHGSLPAKLQVALDCGEKEYSFERNGAALTATAALLLDGALTGKAPAASVLAVVGEDGKLALPPRFWQTLRAISALPTGTRLILPEEAADFLTALVTLDDAAFFMKNEVLLAGTVDEMCELASPDPAIAAGLKQFEVIRRVGEGKALGAFAAHPSTQQRLRDLVAALPAHASARMLALQGSGSRPRFLERPLLAREIRSALEPAGYLISKPARLLDSDELQQAHQACREGLDKLTGYIGIRDRDIHKQAVDVADSLRTLARLLPEPLLGTSLALTTKHLAACRDARNDYIRVMKELNAAAGDGEDFPLPKVVEVE